MTTITPGYDFSTNEVPNASLLAYAGENLQITAIPYSALVNQQGILTIAGDSSATNWTADGTLWVDFAGNLWGVTPKGTVKIHVAEGGLESNRFGVNSYWSAGVGGKVLWAYTALGPENHSDGTGPSNVRWSYAGISNVLVGPVLQETCASSAAFEQNCRVLLCGFSPIRHTAITSQTQIGGHGTFDNPLYGMVGLSVLPGNVALEHGEMQMKDLDLTGNSCATAGHAFAFGYCLPGDG